MRHSPHESRLGTRLLPGAVPVLSHTKIFAGYRPMKVALVHDWLTGMRGGEKVLEIFCQMFPDADLYTLVHVKGSVSPLIENRTIQTSFLNRLPRAAQKYRWYLPLMPRAIESFRISGYDLVLSSSHCVAKGIRTGSIPHICYCNTPMRYAWDMYPHYFNRSRFGPATLFAIERIMPYLRRWDLRTIDRVTHYIANSANIAERIERIYHRPSTVIHPPANLDFFTVDPAVRRESYLCFSAFAPYKRVDLAVELFTKIGKPLRVVGSGEDEERLQEMAGPTITFEGRVSDERLRHLYRSARALIFPGEEDFGIVPVEAQGCGTPIIAFGKGGALETVTPLRDAMTGHPSGLFFGRQEINDLHEAVQRFEANEQAFDPVRISHQMQVFSESRFRDQISRFISETLS